MLDRAPEGDGERRPAVRLVDTAAAGRLLLAAPPAELARWIEAIWLLECVEGRRLSGRLYPSPAAELLIQVGEPSPVQARLGRADPLPVCALVGPLERPLVVCSLSPPRLVGVRFRAVAAAAFFGIAASELAGRVVDLRSIREPGACAALVAAAAASEPFERLERVLHSLASDAGPVDTVVAAAARQIQGRHGQVRLAALARAARLSPQTLRRRFSQVAGIAPKRFARLVRLHSALALHLAGERPWAEVAHACGFADSSHLTRECRNLLGVRPSDWARRQRAPEG